MSTKWTYSGDPSTSTRDAVRFTIGDVTPGEPLLTDAEIDFCVARRGSINESSIAAARAVLAKYARLVSSTDDKISREWQQRIENFKELVKQLEDGRNFFASGVFAGGISKAQKETTETDPDRVRPAFTRRLHDNPRDVPMVAPDEEVP